MTLQSIEQIRESLHFFHRDGVVNYLHLLEKIHELLVDWLKALPVLGFQMMCGTDVTCF